MLILTCLTMITAIQAAAVGGKRGRPVFRPLECNGGLPRSIPHYLPSYTSLVDMCSHIDSSHARNMNCLCSDDLRLLKPGIPEAFDQLVFRPLQLRRGEFPGSFGVDQGVGWLQSQSASSSCACSFRAGQRYPPSHPSFLVLPRGKRFSSRPFSLQHPNRRCCNTSTRRAAQRSPSPISHHLPSAPTSYVHKTPSPSSSSSQIKKNLLFEIEVLGHDRIQYLSTS